jgi:eukaryotic-like serine/threonine-protein kinase
MRSFRGLAGSGDAVAALRAEGDVGGDAPRSPAPSVPPSGTAETARLSPVPPSPEMVSGPVSVWRPPPSLDEYRLIELVGRGGMGEVYLAHDEILDRSVAVKVISGIDPDPAAKERFLTEARAAARLQHPNVLTVYRVGELDGRPYLITEFIHGKGLDDIAKPLSWRDVLKLGVGLARGLAAAHRRGVLHRDIKPGNAILTHDGEVKLLDFGLAKLLDGVPPPTRRSAVAPPPPPSAPERQGGSTLVSIAVADASEATNDTRPPLTDAGSLLGTPDYMPPEIWRGEPATRRSDVYALGALLFELAAGYPPHRDLPARTLPQLVQKQDAPLLTDLVPDISTKLAAVVERCLRRDPQERFASGEELRDALEQLELTSRAGSVPEGNPYRGLHTFEAEHRTLFFGRRAETGTILERLRVEALVTVAGDSGVGKSSVCRAGVLPAVLDGALGGGRNWSVVRFVPGRSPMASLATAIAPILGMEETAIVRGLRAHATATARTIRERLGDRGGLVLFIDQLEELVTMSDPVGACTVAEALGHLATGLPGVRLLTTVRSDFLAPVAALPGLGDEIARALYFLKPLSPEGIREAITGPARMAGIRFESEALVDNLVESTRSAAGGGLPLLQFALAEMWEARDEATGVITGAALERIGGVSGALARHADAVILGMTAVQRSAARRILFALVSQQQTPLRRREDEILSHDAAGRAALNGLVRGRLLAVREGEQGPTYELAHEALIRGWDTLRRWLDEQADSRAVRQRLAAAAAEWERLGCAREALWSARQLAELGVVEPDDLTARDTAYVAASRKAVLRSKTMRTIVGTLVPLMMFGAWAGLRIHAQRDLEQRVAGLVDESKKTLAEAQRDEVASLTARGEAFTRFDAGERDRGDAAWQRARSLAQSADRAYGRASQSLETTLMVETGNPAVQGMLGDVLYARALLAEREHRTKERDELLDRLALYDADGTRRQRWSAPAELTIRTTPPGARIHLDRYVDNHGERRLVPVGDLGAPAVGNVVVTPGSYLVRLEMPGEAPVRYPVLLGRGERLGVEVPLVAARLVPEGFAYIPPGRFLFGSPAEEEARAAFFNTAPEHPTSTGAYLIARHETTWADWIAFLRALPAEERARRVPRVSGLGGSLALEEVERGGFQLTLKPGTRAYVARMDEPIRYLGRDRRAVQDWLRLPVSGVSLDDAQAYAAWLAASGRVPGARLCAEREWERAARGADGREFPGGDRLARDDANIDETYGKDPLAFGPDEVGSHPASRSPFGVDDLCGNVFEWTSSSLARGGHALRGGAYYYDRTTARSTNRQVAEPNIRDPNVGIRICASVEAD